MPRRTFFRGGSDKKTSRKQHKQDDKALVQQQSKQTRQQVIQQQNGQVDKLQASSSTTGSDPPLNLNGPTRNAPKHSSGGQPYVSHGNTNVKLSQVQENFAYPQQYQSQSFDFQHNEEQMQAREHELMQHQEHAMHQSTIPQNDPLHLSAQPYGHNPEQSVVPSVEAATDEIWRCGTGDFRSGSLAVQLLRLAVVTDWEKRQQAAEINNEHITTFSYDPSETFLSLQGAALRFHANFESMRADRVAKMSFREKGDGESSHDADEPDSLEWELTEQAAWEVWEESLRAAAALAHASVGPGWRHQLTLRRQLNREAEFRAMYGSSLQQRNRVFDNFSDVSSVGGISLSSYSFDISNPQSSGRFMSSVHDLMVPDIVETFRVIIPEVLPAAMIRFAASVIDCIQPLRVARSKIVWKEEQSQQQMQSIILRLINDERRWIRRIKRLSDTQRDLAFALFCVDGVSDANRNDASNQQMTGNEWSVPRVHVPMATMICLWLTSCAVGWPVPKLFDEVPCQFEEVLLQPWPCHESPETDAAVDDNPPSEIIVSSRDDSQNTVDQVQRVKFSYWDQLVDASRKDWWYTLRVLRDCSDFVSSGWCPPPSGVGNEIVSLLISIALEGLYLFGSFPRFDTGLQEEQICKERLVACSCAAESLATLKNLAARDVLPLDSIDLLSISLCRLLSQSEKIISSLSKANDESSQSNDTMFEKETFTQLTFVASNSAELLWILLSTESTCCSTCDALLNLIDDELLRENLDSNREDIILTASGAVRALSAALWGDPPSVKGVPLLRYFWELVIDLFGKVLSASSAVQNDLAIAFALEIVLAVRRLVDSEMVYGSGDLCPTEWESFIQALDIGISPWFRSKSSPSNNCELFDEISALFTQIQRFLLKAPDMEYGLHPIVDDDSRNSFHIHILRKCVPQMRGEGATGLGLAAIKSWSCVSYLPCRGYVHSPLVRLEALKSLITDRGNNHHHCVDSASVATSVSAETSGTGLSGSIPMLSLFTLTRNLRDLHLELINTLLLPQLIDILAPEYQSADIPTMATTYVSVDDGESEEISPDDYISECIEAEFILRKFAVRVIGLLFKSRSGEGEKRHHFVGLLKHVAVSKPHGIGFWTGLNDDTRGLGERLDLEIFRLRLETIRQLEICLHAPFCELPHTHGTLPTILNATCEIVTFYCSKVAQMDNHADSMLCLAAIIPLARLSCARNGQGIFLARHRVTNMIPECIMSVINDDGWIECCTPMMSRSQSSPIVLVEQCFEKYDDDIAPFVFVRQYQATSKNAGESESLKTHEEPTHKKSRRQSSNSSERSDKTTVDIEPVARVMKHAVRASSRSSIPIGEQKCQATQTGLLSSIRIVCFNTIASFLSHGVSFPSPIEDLDWLDVEAASIDEHVSKSEAIIAFAAILGNAQLSKMHVKENYATIITKTCDALVELALSQMQHPTIVKNACCGLVTMLTSLRKFVRKANKPGSSQTEDVIISGSLVRLIKHMCSLLEHQDSFPDFILIPLINVTRASILCADSFLIPKALRRRIFLACLNMKEQLPWHLHVITFFMLSEIIDLMSSREAGLLLFLALSPGVGKMYADETVIKKDVNQLTPKRTKPLLIDILRCKIANKRLSDAKNQSGISNREPFKVHSQLARKMIAIENFPVELESVHMSAWKCGNTLLTLKMGSRSSLYRGWVEVVLRSPTSTARRLVRVDKQVFSQDPDCLLKFWELLHPRVKHKIEDQKHVTTLHYEQEDSPEVANEVGKSKTFSDALTLIERFDQLLQNDAQSNEIEMAVYKNTGSNIIYSRSDSTSSKRSEISTDATPAFKLTKLKRNISDGDISTTGFNSYDRKGTQLGNDLHSWIGRTFVEHVDGAALVQELEALGFSRASLGIPSACSCSDSALYHEKLKPYTIGSNLTRAIAILDRSTPFQTHRVSLLYGGPLSQKTSHRTTSSNLNDGDQFLLATQASTDFWAFAKELGDIVPVRHLKYFSGGLDTSESSSDGSFAIVWFSCRDESNNIEAPAIVDSMVMFHTVTLMPNKTTNRKRHVGNDIVHIVYGLESETLDVDHERFAISGQFGFVTIYVIPFVCIDMVKISIHLKNGLDESICSALSHLVGSRVVSRKISADIVRTLAQEADLICLSMIEEKLGLVLNIEERFMKINDMNRHLLSKPVKHGS
eukprot:CCRYP_014537-RE/>CCRYP_014537-RE protein AED:0.03 eAED:0.03 QI:291/1/1/1/0.9/0.81/11/143/2162